MKKILQPKVAAIVPAYNEAKRIANVLGVLLKTPIIDEIIVIDDGSSDETSQVVQRFSRVKLLRNKTNQGKAFSLQRGVQATKAKILFFCDADLVGLTPKIIKRIVSPVIEGKYDMFMGIRNNIMQKAVHLFALNSGERALTRDLWEKLPSVFKYRYRIEAGLNFTAKKYGKGYGYKQFNYYQTLKEKKYGILKGALLRWRLNLDVAIAYALIIFYSVLQLVKGFFSHR